MALTRDTLGWAFKATNIVIDNQDIEIYKNPKTGDGVKKSARGLLKVVNTNSGYELVDRVTRQEEQYDNALELFYKDGKFYRNTTLEEIRNRASQYFNNKSGE